MISHISVDCVSEWASEWVSEWADVTLVIQDIVVCVCVCVFVYIYVHYVCVFMCLGDCAHQRQLPQIPSESRVICRARLWAERIYEPLQTWNASYRGVKSVLRANSEYHPSSSNSQTSLKQPTFWKSPGCGNTTEVCYQSIQLGQQVSLWWDVLLASLCNVLGFFRLAVEVWRKSYRSWKK